MNFEIAGEVRFVVKRADGKVKTDTGFQKNMILNQGLDFFGGGKGANLGSYCVIGSGSSVPANTQTSLDNYVAAKTGALGSKETGYVEDGSNLYKVNATYSYRFTGIGDANISEVGLASTHSSSTNYYLCTRALIKDSAGSPTTLTVRTGETLDVFYKLWAVFSTLDTNHTINRLNAVGDAVPYNAICRLSKVGNSDYVGSWAFAMPFNISDGRASLLSGFLCAGELGTITSQPSDVLGAGSPQPLPDYVVGSYKTVGSYFYSLDAANGNVRSLTFGTTMGMFQVRYGSVDDDSPIVKTNKDTLSIPLEFSWGRYEGAL